MRNSYSKRKDDNQGVIESELKELGISFIDTSMYSNLGYDIEIFFGRYCFKVEIKNPETITNKQKKDLYLSLTDNEKKAFNFYQENAIPYIVATDTATIIAMMAMWFSEIKNEVLFKSFFLIAKSYKEKFGEKSESKISKIQGEQND